MDSDNATDTNAEVKDDDKEVKDEDKEVKDEDKEVKDEDKEEMTASEPVAQSYKCSDCGKPLRNEDEMSMHAARTKHTNFAACEDKVKPLDEATKKEQLQRVQDLLAQKRLENEERDRKEQILKEKKRRSEGKEISKLREYKEDFDRKKLMEDLKRDRLQKKLARDQVLDNIRKDREAMQEIRLPTGESLKKEFKAKESLAAVRVYVMTKWSKDDNSVPKLSTAFPRKVYTNDDMAMSLLQLGLVPSAVINVS